MFAGFEVYVCRNSSGRVYVRPLGERGRERENQSFFARGYVLDNQQFLARSSMFLEEIAIR